MDKDHCSATTNQQPEVRRKCLFQWVWKWNHNRKCFFQKSGSGPGSNSSRSGSGSGNGSWICMPYFRVSGSPTLLTAQLWFELPQIYGESLLIKFMGKYVPLQTFVHFFNLFHFYCNWN